MALCDRSACKMEHPRSLVSACVGQSCANARLEIPERVRDAAEARKKREWTPNSRQQLLPRFRNRRDTVANSRAKLPISCCETRKRRGLCERTNVWMQARLRNSWLRRSASYNYCSSAERKAIVCVCLPSPRCKLLWTLFISDVFLFRHETWFSRRSS